MIFPLHTNSLHGKSELHTAVHGNSRVSTVKKKAGREAKLFRLHHLEEAAHTSEGSTTKALLFTYIGNHGR
jgi:hypothetical protein